MPARHTHVIRTLVVSGLLVGGMALAGCGGSDSRPATSTTASPATTAPATSELEGLSAQDVFAKTSAAAQAAQSVHIAGTGTSGGQPIKIDMVLKSGAGGSGSIGLNGSTFEVVVDGQDMYFKADDAFYRNSLGDAYTTAVAALIGGKFLKGPVSDPRLTDFANFGDLKTFMKGTLSPDGAISRIAGKTIKPLLKHVH